jgi:Xaa-Pro aminopeptidase
VPTSATTRTGRRRTASRPVACNRRRSCARLDWERAYKTPYEVACLRGGRGARGRGHQAARSGFVEGASELEIHQAYVSAVGCVERDLPYETIVALDEKGATLHYTGKRTKKHGKRAADRRGREGARLRLGHHAHVDHRQGRRDLPRARGGHRPRRSRTCARW